VSEEPNVQSIASAIAEKLVAAIFDTASDAAKAVPGQLRFSMRIGFDAYVKALIVRHSTIKTLLYRETPQYIYTFYVPLDLRSSETRLLNASVQDLLAHGNCHIVAGTGGSGKSILMRHLLLTQARAGDRLPVFLELRQVNEGNGDLIQKLRDAFAEAKLDLSIDMIEKLLSKGQIALFLDGFDEVDRELRDTVRMQILALAERYPQTLFVVSSRPDEGFVSWSRFHQWTPIPLSKAKAQELVRKLIYDEDIKAKFLSDLGERLYDQQPSFVSNPLLLTIMLISYGTNADVPAKRHLFYSQAFEALWNRHDATKGGYRRQRQAELAMDDFVAVVAAVSMQSYI
jgi:hypothetical protein